MEVLGSNNAWNYVLKKPEVNIETLKQIHKRILFFDVENAGVFRTFPIYVGDKEMFIYLQNMSMKS
jgi:fido (protein-threonine AMPylation protein)